jgi:hypothetical protein
VLFQSKKIDHRTSSQGAPTRPAPQLPAQGIMSQRHIFTPDELNAYFDRICLPISGRHLTVTHLSEAAKLAYLRLLQKTSTRQSPLGEFIAALLLAPHRARLAAALIPQNHDREQQPRRLLLRGELLLPLYPAQSRI